MRDNFRHKKSLGQHFLKSADTALKIVEALPLELAENILEIGPGLGILSKHLFPLNKDIYFSEIDHRIISMLKNDLHVDDEKIIEGDFLRFNISEFFKDEVMVIGNFPYNISSQIVFQVLEHKQKVPVLVGMFQKEMAKRVVAPHGNKEYGVISLLVQAFYNTEYLFELTPDAFDPPPKVHSAVIRLTRKKNDDDIDEKTFRQIVKTAFNQRRKKLSNAMSSIPGSKEILTAFKFEGKRAEQLSLQDFIKLSHAFKELKHV